ncbi:MAG: hypothetical protein ACRD0V_02765 [Acidimicrobiales bacterium]
MATGTAGTAGAVPVSVPAWLAGMAAGTEQLSLLVLVTVPGWCPDPRWGRPGRYPGVAGTTRTLTPRAAALGEFRAVA